MSDEVRVFKLITGGEIIGTIDNEVSPYWDGSYVIKNPLLVVYTSALTNIQFFFIEYNILAEVNEIDIAAQHILHTCLPKADIVKYYETYLEKTKEAEKDNP